MDARPIRSRLTRVRDAVLSAAAGIAVSILSSTSLAAERELARLESPDISLLEKAATRDPEQAARIVAVLERLYVGQSESVNEDNPARAALLSSIDPMLTIRRAGDFGQTEITESAEESLLRLAESETPAASLAFEALERHAVLAESRAISRLRRLGARIIFSDRPDALYDALAQLGDGAATSHSSTESPSPPAPLSVEHVYVLRSWKGGREGLDDLARLRTLGGLQLYLVDGCGLTVEDTLPLKAAIPGLTPIPRSAATLGVRSSYQVLESGGCEISGVAEGLAADRAGLRTNFIITAVDGDPIITFDDGTPRSLVQRLRDCKPRETVVLTVQKTLTSEPVDIPVTLSDWSDVPDVQSNLSHR